jgi:opacity protein-like surface antigen
MTFLRFTAALSICAVLAMPASGQNLTKVGTTSAQFLKIGVGPRAMGMGGAFTATADDITAMYWNPGGLARCYSREAFFNHVKWFADINYDFAAVSTHLSDVGTVGAFVSVLSMDDMKVRTLENPEGTGELFNAGGMAIGLSYARELTEDFSIGFNAKYVREYIWNSSATGFALDVGTMYRVNVLNELRIAASISNFGSKMKMQGRDAILITSLGPGGNNLLNTDIQLDEYDLPLLFRIGLAADVVKSGDSRLTIDADAVHPNDAYEYVNTGMEFAWNDILFLRGGWKSLFERDTEQGLALGIGVQYRMMDAVNLKIDYAYQDFGRLTSVHFVSLGVKF